MPSFNYSKAIFPLLFVETDDNDQPVTINYIGTCFFTGIAQFPCLITAKHVLEGCREIRGHFYIATRYGSQDTLKLIGGVVINKHFDIGVIIIDPSYFSQHKDEFSPIGIHEKELELATDVLTFGYPGSLPPKSNTKWKNLSEVTIDHGAFKGYVHKVVNEAWRGGSKQTYVLSFPNKQGLSGSPLLIHKEGKVLCAGVIYDEDISKEAYDTTEIDTPAGKVKLPLLIITSYALAWSFEHLKEFREMLEDVVQKTGSNP